MCFQQLIINSFETMKINHEAAKEKKQKTKLRNVRMLWENITPKPMSSIVEESNQN